MKHFIRSGANFVQHDKDCKQVTKPASEQSCNGTCNNVVWLYSRWSEVSFRKVLPLGEVSPEDTVQQTAAQFCTVLRRLLVLLFTVIFFAVFSVMWRRYPETTRHLC